MSTLCIQKTEKLMGKIQSPPSKAYSHRAIIAASLSNGQSIIKNPLMCDDISATIRACKLLGAKISPVGPNTIAVIGRIPLKTPEKVINCRGSGTTIRFISSICALTRDISVLTGTKSLLTRPMNPLLNALRQLGVECYSTNNDGTPPLIIFGGGLKGGETSLVGDVSSQFFSSLFFSTPYAKNETKINVLTQLESTPYIEMTLDVLQKHNIKIIVSPNYGSFAIPSQQEYRAHSHLIEGDYSSAAFIFAAAAITNSHVTVTNLNQESLQGDKIMLSILERMGVSLEYGNDHIAVVGVFGELTNIDVDLRHAPDLVPICAVMGCFAEGETIIRGVNRLQFKESNRIISTISEITKMGGKINVEGHSLIIKGKVKLKGANLFSHNDHRIAMACAVAALGAEGKTMIRGSNSIKKSYPNFVNDLKSIGGNINVK